MNVISLLKDAKIANIIWLIGSSNEGFTKTKEGKHNESKESH